MEWIFDIERVLHKSKINEIKLDFCMLYVHVIEIQILYTFISP